jgi:hypothetical protein
VWCDWSFRQLAHVKVHVSRKHPSEDYKKVKMIVVEKARQLTEAAASAPPSPGNESTTSSNAAVSSPVKTRRVTSRLCCCFCVLMYMCRSDLVSRWRKEEKEGS